jgi:hypothetical protein
VLVDGKSLSYDWTVSFSHRAPLALTKQVLQSFLTSFVLASVHVLENLFHFSVQVFSFLLVFNYAGDCDQRSISGTIVECNNK